MQLSYEKIEEAANYVDGLSEEEMSTFAENYMEQQIELMGYLIASAEEFNDEDLGWTTTYLFTVAYKAFELSGVRINKISEAEINDFLEPFQELLIEYNRTENDELLYEYLGQQELIEFMAAEIDAMIESEDISEDTGDALYMVTLSMIGLLNKAIAV